MQGPTSETDGALKKPRLHSGKGIKQVSKCPLCLQTGRLAQTSELKITGEN